MLSLHGPVINLTFLNFETTFPGARVTNIWSWSTCLPMLTPDFPATFLFEYIRSSHSLLLFPFFFFYFFFFQYSQLVKNSCRWIKSLDGWLNHEKYPFLRKLYRNIVDCFWLKYQTFRTLKHFALKMTTLYIYIYIFSN